MVQRFRRKVRKQRGSMHHGYGIQKGHKKAGSRGGVGNAGGDTHEWMHSIKIGKKYGKHGFVRPPRAYVSKKTINIGDLADKAEQLVKKGFATKQGRDITIDTTKMGITKVLSGGKAKKMTIIAEAFSTLAKEKLEKAGGKAQIAE
ncbi:MAG TPA: uL15 family ribosomal protein [candidate division Zixibacteria bacterium]|nr:uL15 family ribosomal protein [candidate division Zixibacteria bacterium]